ncbi:MAG: DUF1192 domain-containing protein [Okeania sp. SIO3H1]|nr:DUF1192 domain-containing protein [Okeania sp. SIO3H1]
MDSDLEAKRVEDGHRLGDTLENASVAELDDLIVALTAEIERVKAIRSQKQAATADANSVFKL